MRQVLPDPFHFAPPVAFQTLPGQSRCAASDFVAERRRKLRRSALRAGAALALLFASMVVLGRTTHAPPVAASHTVEPD